MKKFIPTFEEFLFETEDVYQKSLNDDYWKEISKKFPNYNNPNDSDCDKAVEFILSKMKKKYPNENWMKIENSVRKSIHGGIT